jgi:hypothetical protein
LKIRAVLTSRSLKEAGRPDAVQTAIAQFSELLLSNIGEAKSWITRQFPAQSLVGNLHFIYNN